MDFQPTRRRLLKTGSVLYGGTFVSTGVGRAEKDLRQISYGEKKRGNIDKNDPKYNFPKLETHAEPISFRGEKGDEISMNVGSNTLSGISLALESPTGTELTAGQLKSQAGFLAPQLWFGNHNVLPQTGEYKYWIGGYSPKTNSDPILLGEYAISLKKAGQGHLLSLNESIRGELSKGDVVTSMYLNEGDKETSPAWSDQYLIDGKEGERIEIHIQSKDFVPKVIYKPRGEDSVLATRSGDDQKSVTFTHTFPDEGNLLIIVTAPQNLSSAGRYRLKITQIKTNNRQNRTSSELATIIEEKRSLASSINKLSISIDDKKIVEGHLNKMERKAKGGKVNTELAYNAIERMAMGENLTESLLAGIGPKTIRSLDTSKNTVSLSVGASKGSPGSLKEYNFLGDFVSFVYDAIFVFSFGFYISRGLRGDKVEGAASSVANKVDDYLARKMASSSSRRYSRARKWLKGNLIPGVKRAFEPIEDGEPQRTAGNVFVNLVDSPSTKGSIKTVGETIEKNKTDFTRAAVNQLQKYFELWAVTNDPIGKKLGKFHSKISSQVGRKGELTGRQQGAKDGGNNLLVDMRAELKNSHQQVQRIKTALKIVQTVELYMALLDGPSPIADGLLLITNIAGNLWGAHKAWSSIPPAIKHHHEGLDAIANGGWS